MSAVEQFSEELAKLCVSYFLYGAMPGDTTHFFNVARTLAVEFERATQERDENCRLQTRLLREIVELLARPDGIGGQRAVQRVRRRVRRVSRNNE